MTTARMQTRLWRSTSLFLAAMLSCAFSASAGVIVHWSKPDDNTAQGTITGSFSAAELSQAYSVGTRNWASPTSSVDTSPSIYNIPQAGDSASYRFYTPDPVSFIQYFTNLNNYSGNVASGDVFGWAEYYVTGTFCYLYLPENYVADTPINGVLTLNSFASTLEGAFTFGDVVTLNGEPFITYSLQSNVETIPEPATMSLLALGLVAQLRRRRRNR